MKIEIFTSTLKPHKPWCAHINGPWYTDSNPEGWGASKQKALDAVWDNLLETQKEINEFIALGKPTLEQIERQN